MIKPIKKILFILTGLILILVLWLNLTDRTYLIEAVRVTWLQGKGDVTIDDFRLQKTRIVKKGRPQTWKKHADYNKVPLSPEIRQLHDSLQSLAFLVIKDGKLIQERYFREGGPDHATGMWSVTKSFTAMMVLKAIEEGRIDNLDDPLTQYLPDWTITQDPALTLKHLGSMNTGLFWDEQAHDPLALITKLNFTSDLEAFVLEDMYAIGPPGSKQHYNSGGTQTLGLVLDRILQNTTISEYFATRFWQPLGCENHGQFLIDGQGFEKTFGGMVSTARDLSKFGQLLLNRGQWQGKQLLSEASILQLTTKPYNNTTYTFGLWTGAYEDTPFYYLSGFLGQVCIAVPEHGLVITRLGHKATAKPHLEAVSPDVYTYIAEAMRITNESLD
jgi:CubicO group peptidase (beta-lactamase class C family)